LQSVHLAQYPNHETIRLSKQSIQVQSGGSFDIDYMVMGPLAKIILTGEKERQGDFVFTATVPGEYSFCFDNSISTFADKVIDIEIAVSAEAYSMDVAPSNVRLT
jgi:hypothetical protein